MERCSSVLLWCSAIRGVPWLKMDVTVQKSLSHHFTSLKLGHVREDATILSFSCRLRYRRASCLRRNPTSGSELQTLRRQPLCLDSCKRNQQRRPFQRYFSARPTHIHCRSQARAWPVLWCNTNRWLCIRSAHMCCRSFLLLAWQFYAKRQSIL